MTIAQNYYNERNDWRKKLARAKEHGRTRFTKEDTINIIDAFVNHLEPMMSIAIRYHSARASIWKLLKRSGIDTSKRKLQVSCKTCGSIIDRPKSQIRNKKNHFCNMQCYQAFLEAGASHLTPTENRQGSKRARAIVNKYFKLQPGNIVHHEDRFNLNNQPWNLRVFKTQGDHIRHHRGFDVEPIWDGSNL